MSLDIDEMEKMLNNYLAYAKSRSLEKTIKINIKELFDEIKNEIGSEKIKMTINENYFFIGRKLGLKRCFNNIINNGLIYGKIVFVSSSMSKNRLSIIIDDDGPGIPEEHFKNVFKPFYRLDKARSLNNSGVGLGLAISEDIINSHGGLIQLGKSSYKGLQVKILLPL